MKIQNALFAALLGLSFAGAAGAQVISYSPRTGDIWVDSQLGYMNDYGRDNRDYFADDIVNNFGAPRYLVNDLLTTRHWAPGDVYYACALAYQLRRPCGDIVRDYDRNRGQGWGVIAQRMGIKPGSAQFHALKGQLGKSNGRFKAHGGPGNSGKSSQVLSGDGPGNSGHQGNGNDRMMDEGPGNSGNAGKGKGNEKGKGKGKDKGQGKP
jgi:hypothetical protein